MTKKAALAVIALIALLSLVSGSVLAQTYSFSLPKEVVNAYLNKDGTLELDYVWTFANDPGASPIDYVDAGLPNGNYNLSSVTADVNGNSITDITQASSSNLQGGQYGVTLALGSYAIPPGQTGTVHLHVGSISGVLNPYTYNNVKDYVSFNFSPTWFGSAYVHGATDLTVAFHLPPGVQPSEPIYYTPSSNWPGPTQPATALDSQNRVLYTWTSPNANGSTQYTFGAGFPAKYIPAAAIVRQPSIQIQPQNLICYGGVCLFLLFIGFSLYSAIWGSRRRKLQYLPPKISIEGHGIKRGLTAVEAAILMEQPMDKVLTMILFGAVKKGAATVITREPLAIKETDPLPEGLQPYELDFLKAFQEKNTLDQRKALQEMMVTLVKSVSEKMKGFSRKETVAYYEDIIKKAWEQVEAADTPEVKSQKYDEVMDWTMLDKNYSDRTRNVFGSGPVFVPMWWPAFDPVYRSSMGGMVGPAVSTGLPGGGGGMTVNLPHLPGSDFAASIANSVQSVAGGVVGNVTSFTNGITNRTNPVPPPTTSGSGWHGPSSGGGHCACACACAGCACACAGGGR
ncbi:MAG: hypothetical protein M1281_10650 [Chloroflexi bacterium]|nr:hypothetical protein [Chloroflexota bacterium]